MTGVPARTWSAVLGGERAAAAVAAARDVATRLRDPHRAAAAASIAVQQTAFPETSHWQPYGLAQGNAGLTILFGYLDSCFPVEGWDAVAHRHLTLAARTAEEIPYLSTGVFSGLSGLAFAAWQLSRGGSRYRRLLDGIEQILLPEIRAELYNLGDWRHDVNVGEFDAISGLSGVAAYLLCRRGDSDVSAALQALISSLVAMTHEDNGIPRWYTANDMLWDETMREAYPHGNLNCGLAHGIPGPLAILALARLDGVWVDGLDEAIDRVAGWLSMNRCDDEWGVNWPTAVALETAETEDGPTLRGAPATQAPWGPSRAAWCYGAPGVARAMWLAGEARGHSGYQQLAVEAMKAIYERPISSRSIDSPTFCHGVAGLMQVTLRFANATGLPVFHDAAEALADQLLELYEPDSLLGFRDLEFHGRKVDQPGLLTGAPGVALTLLAASTNIEPTWDRLFLLS